VNAVAAVVAGGGIIISIIMITKSGPTIAAYEAYITLFLLFSTVGIGGVSRRQAGFGLDCILFSLGLSRELDLRYLRNEPMLSYGSDGDDDVYGDTNSCI
jgi:hypothetical protein